MIKAIFFDFDMTLVNSKPIAHASYRALLNYKKLKPTEKGFDAYIGRRVSESVALLAKNEKEKKRLIKIFLKIHESKIKNLKVYGKELLKYLKSKKIKVIIISNNAREVIRKVCKTHKLHFDMIIADENMLEGEEKHQAITRTLKKLKLGKNEIFYVGDHINDINEARKAKIKIISVATGVFSKKDLSRHNPDFIISDLNQIKGII